MAVIRFEEADHYLASGKPPWPSIFLLYGEEVLYKKILDKLITTLLGKASRTLNYESIEGLNENVPAALAAVKSDFGQSADSMDELDGITIDCWDTGGWWFNVRASNTEPLLRLNLEAADRAACDGPPRCGG